MTAADVSLRIYEETRRAVETGDLIAPEPDDDVDQPPFETGPPVHGQWTEPGDTQQGGEGDG